MKKLSLFFTVTLLIALMSSCGSSKNIPYLKNSDTVNFDKSQYLYSDLSILRQHQERGVFPEF